MGAEKSASDAIAAKMTVAKALRATADTKRAAAEQTEAIVAVATADLAGKRTKAREPNASPAQIDAVGRAQIALAFAQENHAEASGEASRALAEATAAEQGVEQLVRETDAAAEWAEHRSGASVETVGIATRGHFEKIIEAKRVIATEALAIGVAFDCGNAHRAWLRERGESVTPLDSFHLVVGLVTGHADASPEVLAEVMNNIHRIRQIAAPSRSNPNETAGNRLRKLLLRGFDFTDNLRTTTPPADVPRLRTELGHYAAAADHVEAQQMRQDDAYRRGDLSEVARRRRENLPPPAGATVRHGYPGVQTGPMIDTRFDPNRSPGSVRSRA